MGIGGQSQSQGTMSEQGEVRVRESDLGTLKQRANWRAACELAHLDPEGHWSPAVMESEMRRHGNARWTWRELERMFAEFLSEGKGEVKARGR